MLHTILSLLRVHNSHSLYLLAISFQRLLIWCAKNDLSGNTRVSRLDPFTVAGSGGGNIDVPIIVCYQSPQWQWRQRREEHVGVECFAWRRRSWRAIGSIAGENILYCQ